jgi:hypothetical protein
MQRDRDRLERRAALHAARAQGCVCRPELAPDIVEGVRVIATRHDDWCPLLKIMEERPPGLSRAQVLLVRETGEAS